MKTTYELVEADDTYLDLLTMTHCEEIMAGMHKMGHNYVGELRWGILGEGNYEGDAGIVQFATENRGAASESYPD
eukprot:1979103-Ditylum_brightwellii.AAC.1